MSVSTRRTRRTWGSHHVIVIEDGKVSVAGQSRQGTPMSPEEVVASADEKETTQELAGHGHSHGADESATAGWLSLNPGDRKCSPAKTDMGED